MSNTSYRYASIEIPNHAWDFEIGQKRTSIPPMYGDFFYRNRHQKSEGFNPEKENELLLHILEDDLSSFN